MKKTSILLLCSLLTLHYSLAQKGTIQLPATGQTTSYYPGDDGDLQMGVPISDNRFTDHGNGSATDEFTGLMWVTDGNLMATKDPDFDQDRTAGDGDINWITALNYIQQLNGESYMGYSDWRLPNAMELRSLVNLGNDSLTLPDDHPFINLKEGYWSSTTSARFRSAAISVYLSKYYVHANLTYPAGHFESHGKNLGDETGYFEIYLLPVRDGEQSGAIEIPLSGQLINYYAGDDGETVSGIPWPSPRLIDNNDGSVTDRLTGLMWTKDMDVMFTRDPDFDTTGNSFARVEWTTALDYIQKLNEENFMGYNNWRLPNRNELTSLIDHSRSHPSIPKNHPFESTWPQNSLEIYTYWTSSTLAYEPNEAWVYSFQLSNLYYYEKSEEMAVWPVRTDINNLPSGSIIGHIEGAGLPKKGIEITIEGLVNTRTEVGSDGQYSFSGIPDGTYTVTPSSLHYAYTPSSKTITVIGSQESCDFTARSIRAYGWVDISSSLFPIDYAAGTGLRNMYFINDDEGWITSTSDIFHTTDGGETFEIQQTQLGGGTTAIHMLDANNGYCGGDGGWIYKTSDGGQNWDLLASMGNVLDIDFPANTSPSNPIGYACGNNGIVWEITSTLTNLNSPSGSDFGGISAPSINNVWVCGGNRIYYYDGYDFTSQIAPGGTFNDIHFINNQLGWVVGNGGNIGGTQTGGMEPWQTLLPHATDNRSYYGVHSPNGIDVYVVGIPGMIMHSPNGNDFFIEYPVFTNNTIWNQQAKGLTNEFLAGVFFTSPTNGYCTGNNGTLLKYTLLEGAPEGADILDVAIQGQLSETNINPDELTAHVEIPEYMDISQLVPEIFTSAGATIDPPSGQIQDFTYPVEYTVTASDASTKTWTVTVTQTEGFEEEGAGEELGFEIFPNPAKNWFKVQSSRFKVGGATLELYDLGGRKLIEIQIPAGSEDFEVDVSSLESGIYFCKISTQKYSTSRKIIIQK